MGTSKALETRRVGGLLLLRFRCCVSLSFYLMSYGHEGSNFGYDYSDYDHDCYVCSYYFYYQGYRHNHNHHYNMILYCCSTIALLEAVINCVSDFLHFDTSRNSEHKGVAIADVIVAHYVIILLNIIVIGYRNS